MKGTGVTMSEDTARPSIYCMRLAALERKVFLNADFADVF